MHFDATASLLPLGSDDIPMCFSCCCYVERLLLLLLRKSFLFLLIQPLHSLWPSLVDMKPFLQCYFPSFLSPLCPRLLGIFWLLRQHFFKKTFFMFHNTSGGKLKESGNETGWSTSSSSSSSMLPYLIPEMVIIPYFTFPLCHKTHHLMSSEIICVTSYMVSVSGKHKELVTHFHYVFFHFSWWGCSKSCWTPGSRQTLW